MAGPGTEAGAPPLVVIDFEFHMATEADPVARRKRCFDLPALTGNVQADPIGQGSLEKLLQDRAGDSFGPEKGVRPVVDAGGTRVIKCGVHQLGQIAIPKSRTRRGDQVAPVDAA
jgi:hypothetical protein